METRAILGEFNGDRRAYRAYVESGKGEEPVTPFERAAAGLVLGSEEFLGKVRRLLRARKDTGREPTLTAMRRLGRATPEEVERIAGEVFAEERPARRRRLVMYALREHSSLRTSDVARRCGRTQGAVSLVARDLEAEAARNPDLAYKLQALRRRLQRT